MAQGRRITPSPKISFRTNVNAEQLRNNDMLFERALYVYIIAYGCHMCSSAITTHSALHFVTGWLAGAVNKIE
jgi:hypothetical protein